MNKAPPVHIVLRGSRIAVAAIVLVATSTLAVILTLPFPPWVFGLALIALAGWAAHRIRNVGLRRDGRSVAAVRLDNDRAIEIESVDGTRVRGSLRDISYVGARWTTLVWRVEGERRSRSLLILPDMLPAEDFRRLRVLMRYGRSDVTGGAPASHASASINAPLSALR